MKKRRNGGLWAGLGITGLWTAMVLVGWVWTPYSPTAMNGGEKYLAPCLAHRFGTDNFGRDILSRVMKGAGTTFAIGAMTVRMMSSVITGEMRRDYVRTAIARGNDRSGVLRRHVLKNALVPVITFLAQTMAEIVAGSIVVEQVFAIPGLGRMLVASISNRDYPVVQAIVVILALWVVLSGTVADLINQRIDPRLRLGGAK